jgi:16S rRNA (uracil1498-N3)-methyltransferase
VSAGEKMDSTLRKAVELGVAEVQPVLAARSVARPKGERAESRRGHWQKVVIAACEQCGRNKVPEVRPLISLADYVPGEGAKILLSPSSQTGLSKLSFTESQIVLAAGPEAGFTDEEEVRLVEAGFVPASLGPRVLRTETAAVAALAALNALRGDS